MNRKKMDKYAKYKLAYGFSLIELLVAVAIFAAMAAMAWGGLSSIVRTRADLVREQDDFRALMRAVALFDRDLRQAVVRSVRSNYGTATVPAFIGAADRMEFTRLGFANPQAELRSNLQRVLYQLDGDKLERGVYAVLDRAPGTQPQMTVLRDKVGAFRLRYLDAQQRWVAAWPEPNGNAADGTSAALPRAVEVHLETAGYGEITRVIELVSDWPTTDPGLPGAGS
ncbi:MAG TPA: type II secretion system minor pseudopilin GspJ [Rudaea sp.]|jgi:general secretion pathway protein J|uniref:type II secretion system minor pseudopilin GspJ n=1 Tax=Rudaea sp. TaxID=2136325 RepID=UPI002F9333DF